MNIYQRINAVQKEVKYVQKDALISGAGSYKAVTHDQVVSVIREQMVNNGIVVYPEQLKGDITKEKATKSGSVQYLYSGSYAIHFVNMEDGNDRLTVTVEAHALDSGDKGTGKALTYATKSAMLKVFNLETGENDESRSEGNKTFSDEQKEMYDELVDSDKAIEFLEFLSPLTEAAQADLYNSGEKGEKVKLKKKHDSLIKEAHKKIDSYAETMQGYIAQQSNDELAEFCEELTRFEKALIANRLSDIELQYVKEVVTNAP